jgi:diguanylate cyclase (GGDEF)-like protein
VIVDDSKLNLRLLCSIAAEIPDVVIHPFQSSNEALAWIHGQDIDCFVFDYHMPSPDGLELIRLVRATEAFALVPIVIVTGEHEREIRYKALAAGANDFVLKPVDYHELVARLTTLLALESAQKQLSMKIETLEASLLDSERRSREHAERLEALWQIANNPNLRGHDLVLAMLQQAASAIRSNQRFRGTLGRIEDDHVIVVGVGFDPKDADPAGRLAIGRRVPIEKTLASRVERTKSWDDLHAMVEVPESSWQLGWRSAISTRFEAGGTSYSLTFASHRATTIPFGEKDYAYIEVLASIFANQLQVNQLESSLRDAEERSRQHARRLEALWRIINNPNLRDEELWQAMLAEAAAAIRPGQPYRGTLGRVQGEQFVLEAIVEAPGFGDANFKRSELGQLLPLDATVVGTVLAAGGGTQSWDDIQVSDLPAPLVRLRGWRSFLTSTFSAGGSTWALTFASSVPSNTPLGPQDHTYVEVLASFFANNLQQRWQFDRIQYQQSHDALTGLLNRSQFRSRARMAAGDCGCYGIILIDVNALREVNEYHGHMIGDALLVEIATGLRERATGSELVGRIGGDIFGIFVPNPNSEAAMRDRAATFADIFASGFSTGDREGKDFIRLTASAGIAIAPAGGASFDTTLSQADAALFIAKARGPGSMLMYETGMQEAAQQGRATDVTARPSEQ